METLEQQAISETFSDVDKFIRCICHKFLKHYNFNPCGDYDDLNSEANLIFLDAYQNYDPQKGSFTNHIHFRIWHGLLEKLVENSFLKVKGTSEINELIPAPKENQLIDLLDELSDDATTITKLLTDTPKDLQDIIIEERKEIKRGKAILFRYLRKVGWTHKRIKETFKEITEVVNDN